MNGVATESSASVRVEVAWSHDDEAESVRRNLLLSPLVIWPPLFTSVHAAHGHALRLVEERRRAFMLPLSILDYAAVPLVVSIHGQADAARVWIRVADQPRESVLSLRGLAQELIAKVDDVSLI